MSELLHLSPPEQPKKLWFEGPNYTADAVIINPASERLLLIQRKDTGQWALPGGRCDPGETLEEAALRELHEELGLEVPSQDVLGVLDDYPTRSGYAISPVITWLDDASGMRLNPQEVASAHRFRLDQILGDDAVDFEVIPESPRPLVRLRVGEQHIHAPTAAVIYQFRELVAGRITRVADLEQPVFAWR